jgi:cupin 2 domain-containing protein
LKNLFDNLPSSAREEFLTLVETENIRIERIVSNGQASPDGFWYEQPGDEWVLLLKGAAVLKYGDGRPVALQPGDHLSIPAHTRHRVEFVSADAIWLAVHYGFPGSRGDLSQKL